jgi:hypothetical protein
MKHFKKEELEEVLDYMYDKFFKVLKEKYSDNWAVQKMEYGAPLTVEKKGKETILSFMYDHYPVDSEGNKEYFNVSIDDLYTDFKDWKKKEQEKMDILKRIKEDELRIEREEKIEEMEYLKRRAEEDEIERLNLLLEKYNET